MPKYLYKAKKPGGQIVTGTVLASNIPEAEEILAKNKLQPEEVEEESEMRFGAIFSKKINVKDRAVFARQMATMIDAGMTLTKSMRVMATQADNDKLQDIYHQVYKDLEEGLAFSTALAKHPDAFDQVFVSIVKSGETTGNLNIVLDQMATRLENENDFLSKVKSALYYPIFVAIALVLIAGYMLVVVIPNLEEVFAQSGTQLPWATRALISLSDFFSSYWYAVIIALFLLIVGLRYWWVSESGSRIVSKWQIKIPGVRDISVGMYMSRFARVMEMLIKSGVPILDSLRVSSGTMNNVVYEESLINISHQVEKGVPLSSPLQKNPYFPNLIGQMVAVGEETGRLDQVLDKVASYYESETEQRIKSISSLFEPIIIVLVGIGVAFLIFAVLVPIYSIAQLQ